MLHLHRNTPFTVSTRVSLNDYFTGDDTTKIWELFYKSTLDLGAAVEAGDQFYYRNNGGVTVVDSTHIQLNEAAGIGAVIVVPGQTKAIFKAYDQEPNNIVEVELYLGDYSDIQTIMYEAPIGYEGIKFQMVNKDDSLGLDPEWFQFAPANADGTPGTYGSAGDPIYFPDIVGATVLDSGADAEDTEIEVDDPTDFFEGCYVFIGDDITQEIVKVTTIAGNVFQTEPLRNSYIAGTNVKVDGLKFYGKMTLPTPAGGPINWLAMAAELEYDSIDRS